MIVVVGGIKGGSGKTTVATNLAIMRMMAGKDVLLVDADDQETSTDFTTLRNNNFQLTGAEYTSIKLTGHAVRTETQRLTSKYDEIIIDTGGRDTTSQRAALSIANIALIPFIPRSFDVWTLERIGQLVEEMRTVNPNLIAYTFINRADPRGQDNSVATEVLRETTAFTFIDAPLGSRKAFSNAAAKGLSVVELKPPDQKASEEMKTLERYVFNIKKESE